MKKHLLMFSNFLLTALRSLRKNPAASFLNIFGLAAGMTAAILIFLWVNNEKSYDRYHPDASHIYRITTRLTVAKWTWENSPYWLAGPIKARIPEVRSLACFTPGWDTKVRVGNDLFIEKHCAFIDTGWFSLFHYDFLRGDPAGFFRHPFNVLLTRSKARKYFGEQDPIGRIIHVDSIDYRVAAIVGDNPANSSFQFDMLIPVAAWLTNANNRQYGLAKGNFEFETFLQLRPDVRPEKVASALNAIYTKGESKNQVEFSLIPLKDIHFESDISSTLAGGEIEHANGKPVIIFSILGIVVLLIACINYINLTTARASTRAKEVGIRKIVGAGKPSLFLQFTIETAMVSCASLLITVLSVWLLMPFFRELTDRNYPNPLSSATTWTIIGCTVLTVTVLNSIYPALVLSSFRPLNVLKGVTLLHFKDAWLRRGLVVFQFTFSIILIAGTMIIQRQLSYVQHLDQGYNRSQVFRFYLSWHHFDRGESIKRDLLARSSIQDATFANESIVQMDNFNSGSADWDGHDKNFTPTVYQFQADEDYARVMGIGLQQGRWFDPARPEDKKNFILNETAVKVFNLHKPVLGQRFTFQGDTGKIIGVAKDFHFASLHQKIAPFVFYNYAGPKNFIFIRTRPGNATTALADARSIWQRYFPDQPFDYSFLDDEFDHLYKADSKTSTLMLLFSTIAILISCLGLVGLAAFTAQRRIKEIGIRKVLGATLTDIVALLSWEFMRLVFLSVLISTPLAWWATNAWLQDFAYHIPLTGWTFAAAAVIAVLIALLTVSSQSLKAAATNPVNNLRSE
jgi:ABC-type antimicrobial peptide transport system permease subunit